MTTKPSTLREIEDLASQIPSSSSFASASLARKILERVREMESTRNSTSSNNAQPASAPLPSTGKP